MPEHRAGLRFVAVAAGVDDHLPGDPGGDGRAVPGRDQVQREVDAAGDAGRGDDPVVDDVQDVADDHGPRVAPGQLVLQVVVGGAAAAVEQAGLAERVGAGADAGHRAAPGVVVPRGPAREAAPMARPSARASCRQPGTTIRSSGPSSGQSAPARSGSPARWAPRPARPRSAARSGARSRRPWRRPARARPGPAGAAPGTSRKTTRVTIRSSCRGPAAASSWSTVAMVANRPASAYSVRAMTSSAGSVRGSARISATRLVGGRVAVRDRDWSRSRR